MTQIRKEVPADAPAIEAVTIEAFRGAAHASHTESCIVRALRRSGRLTLSLVVEDEGSIIGHIAVSPVDVSDGSRAWYGLGPVSVVPARQRQGIGTLLVKHALEQLRALGAAGCVVLGEPGYYGRFGFRTEPSLVLAGVPAGYFQAIAFRGPVPSAAVTYHDAFAATA